MAASATITRSRRLPFWAIIIALVICALAAVFVLLWFKLPTYTPEWVVEHSPWVDPIVRAVEFESQLEVASKELASRGGSVAPAMVGYLDSDNPLTVSLACRVLREVTNPMMIEPVVAKLKRGKGLSYVDESFLIKALAKQSPSDVLDRLLPLPQEMDETTRRFILLLGHLDDPRAIATLRNILWNNPPKELSGLQIMASPATIAAAAMTFSPVPQAREILRQALTESELHVRISTLGGLVMPVAGERKSFDDGVGRAVILCLDHPDAMVRSAAATVAGITLLPGAEEILIAKLERAEPSERSSLIFGLGGRHASHKAIQVISQFLRDADPEIQRSAVDALGRLDDPAVVPLFLEALPALSESVKTRLVYRMGKKALLASPDAVPLLFLLLEASDFELAKSAERALLKVELDEERQARFKSLRERLYQSAK